MDSYNVQFAKSAIKDYDNYILKNEKLKHKFDNLIVSIFEDGYFVGIGQPEPLKFGYSGYWSRRLNHNDRLIYTVANDKVLIISVKGHY
ncbi:Txe/YoeB family addiction module toxin [Companilactobacillus ginsenosidimutans]|uniref:Endoribonuclease YoeB n=1 Tax=Companilactobacillus ginsenosidimutans TaxID=1007676 RepID=A0A0H4QH48_9LACO|nr:Txe/YoeB family addiction module toxin [Companilactobacillus ginsenosidimutans]AKP67272.1 hypothetical protein ABM34_06775 [Companilactobacillus ginsenosidimutans]